MATVLVVDDDPAIGRLVSLILRTENIQVKVAESGEQGMDFLQDGVDPDLILLDLMMPGMDGREFYGRARGIGISCPVVLCSSYGAEAANKELHAQGAIDKPFDPDTLIETVSGRLNGPNGHA